MKKLAVIITTLALISSYIMYKQVTNDVLSSQISSDALIIFENWRQIHNKNYQNPRELFYRLQVFSDNLKHINKVNSDFKNGLSTWKAGLNQYSDIKYEDFFSSKIRFERYSESDEFVKNNNQSIIIEDPPAELDWRKTDKLLPIQDQLYCSSGYAFSAMDGIATAVAIKSSS